MTARFHVLLVEDNEADAYLARETLEASDIPIDIATAVDGVEARAYLMKRAPFESVRTPDLVLLDLNLPGIDGTQLLGELREHPTLRSVPVVVLTSSDAERDIATSYALGANCYVTKPVGIDAFQSILRAVENFWLTVVKLP